MKKSLEGILRKVMMPKYPEIKDIIVTSEDMDGYEEYFVNYVLSEKMHYITFAGLIKETQQIFEMITTNDLDGISVMSNNSFLD